MLRETEIPSSVQGGQSFFAPDGYQSGATLHGPSSAQDGLDRDAKGHDIVAVLDGPVESEEATSDMPQGYSNCAPLLSPCETGEGHTTPAALAIGAVPSPVSPEIILELQELQVRRKHWVRQSTKTINGIGALVRREMGWGQVNADNGAIKDKAAKFVKAFMAGKPFTYSPSAALVQDLEAAKAQLEISWRAERQIALRMEKLARKLPGYGFAKSVAGFGDLGFAVLVGEAGDLAKYETVSHSRGYEKLWKRLGLAPYNGQALSNWRRQGGLSAGEWEVLGYAPKRRAEVFAVIEDPLFRHQSSRKGPYHAIYLKRRERTDETHPDWSKGHSHGDAKRIMIKRLVQDLWEEWRRCCLGNPVNTGGG
jgi:hypothetical protein